MSLETAREIEGDGARPLDTVEPLRLFLPGAFANMGDALSEGFAALAPGVELEFHTFVPSGVLAREIIAGAPADVYVSANLRFMDEVRRAGLAPAPRPLAGNRLCLIVRPDRAHLVAALADLTRDGLRVVTPQAETDPCGQYVREMFARAGLTTAMEGKAARGELLHSLGSGDLPAFLADDRADAGVFYVSEALALGATVVAVALPPALDMRDQIVFTIAAIVRYGRSHPAAERFVAFLTGPDGQRLLRGFGFLEADDLGSA